jgi:hypothetical protein
VWSNFIEHHELLHGPSVCTIPPSRDLAVRLGEEPVKVSVAVISLVERLDVCVDMVTLDRVDIETSCTEFPHLGDSYLGVKLSSATSRTE